jgi:hypothetical protein
MTCLEVLSSVIRLSQVVTLLTCISKLSQFESRPGHPLSSLRILFSSVPPSKCCGVSQASTPSFHIPRSLSRSHPSLYSLSHGPMHLAPELVTLEVYFPGVALGTGIQPDTSPVSLFRVHVTPVSQTPHPCHCSGYMLPLSARHLTRATDPGTCYP